MRAADSGSRVLIYMDGYYRSGKMIDHKASAEIAVATAEKEGQKIDKVLVWKRYPEQVHLGHADGRGARLLRRRGPEGLPPGQRRAGSSWTRGPAVPHVHERHHRQAEGLPAPHRRLPRLRRRAPRSTSRTSTRRTSTGAWPTSAGSPATRTSSTGRSRSAPPRSSTRASRTYPDAGRPWRIAERLDVNIFHTSPTAIRMLRKAGPDEPKKYNYHFKHMTTVGEPIEPEVWRWYYEVVGKGEAVIVDTWWQTETGGFLCSTKPALDPMKPGSAGPGMPGIYPVILDEDAKEMSPGTRPGGQHLHPEPVARDHPDDLGRPRPVRRGSTTRSTARTRTARTGSDWPYFAGDGALHAADGYFRILGRVDDVINVAGHRLGTKELESACLTVVEVAEAAVVPVVDEVKGRVARDLRLAQAGLRGDARRSPTRSSRRSRR